MKLAKLIPFQAIVGAGETAPSDTSIVEEEEEELISSQSLVQSTISNAHCTREVEMVGPTHFVSDAKVAMFQTLPHSVKSDVHLRLNALEFIVEFGLCLYRTREKVALSAKKLAQLSSLSLPTISTMESGQTELGPRIDSIQKYLRHTDGGDDLRLVLTGLDSAVRENLRKRGSYMVKVDLDEPPNEFSATLVKELRELSGSTARDLENKMDRPNGFLSRIERGKLRKGVTLKTLYLIASACGFHLSVVNVGEENVGN